MLRDTLGGLSDKFTIEAMRRSGDLFLSNKARVWQSHTAEAVFLEILQWQLRIRSVSKTSMYPTSKNVSRPLVSHSIYPNRTQREDVHIFLALSLARGGPLLIVLEQLY